MIGYSRIDAWPDEEWPEEINQEERDYDNTETE